MTSRPRPLVSVVVPTYNRADSLRETLASLLAQDLQPHEYEVIVADNNSNDSTPAVVDELSATSEVDVVYLKETRQGVHYARNSAAKVAKADILYYTDDDVIVGPNVLRAIIEPFSDPTVGSVGGKVLPRWESEPPAWISEFPDYYLSLLDYGEDQKTFDYAAIYSCNQAIRKDLLFTLGGFHPENTAGVWVGDGESGLLLDLLAAGYKILYEPIAVVWHTIPAYRLTQNYMNKRAANEGSCVAFTRYRKERQGRARLLVRSVLELGLAVTESVKSLGQRLFARQTWRMSRSQFSFWLSRAGFDLRLATQRELREMVGKGDWL